MLVEAIDVSTTERLQVFFADLRELDPSIGVRIPSFDVVAKNSITRLGKPSDYVLQCKLKNGNRGHSEKAGVPRCKLRAQSGYRSIKMIDHIINESKVPRM